MAKAVPKFRERILKFHGGTPCGHNFCLKCFQKWIGQGKHSCAKCRAPLPPKLASQPRISSALVVAIRIAKTGSASGSGCSSTHVYHFIGNENRPETAFATEWAKKACKANACSGQIFVTIAPDHFGPILPEHHPKRRKGVFIGQSWEDRMECRQWGAHFPHVAGIAGQSTYGAQSVTLSGGYKDDDDHGEWFLYTGSGDRDLSGNKRTNMGQPFDQRFKKTNEALRVSCKKGYPVRVVRSLKEKRSAYAPEKGVRYDGVYRIEKCCRKVGIQGFKVCRHLFVRCDNQPAPWSSDEQGNRPMPLPKIGELKQATDITERKGTPARDYEALSARPISRARPARSALWHGARSFTSKGTEQPATGAGQARTGAGHPTKCEKQGGHDRINDSVEIESVVIGKDYEAKWAEKLASLSKRCEAPEFLSIYKEWKEDCNGRVELFVQMLLEHKVAVKIELMASFDQLLEFEVPKKMTKVIRMQTLQRIKKEDLEKVNLSLLPHNTLLVGDISYFEKEGLMGLAFAEYLISFGIPSPKISVRFPLPRPIKNLLTDICHTPTNQLLECLIVFLGYLYTLITKPGGDIAIITDCEHVYDWYTVGSGWDNKHIHQVIGSWLRFLYKSSGRRLLICFEEKVSHVAHEDSRTSAKFPKFAIRVYVPKPGPTQKRNVQTSPSKRKGYWGQKRRGQKSNIDEKPSLLERPSKRKGYWGQKRRGQKSNIDEKPSLLESEAKSFSDRWGEEEAKVEKLVCSKMFSVVVRFNHREENED